MSKAHLLVADDEENMLMTLRFILEAEGYRVDTAKNGREALNRVLLAKESDDPVNLIIMDIQMPYVSGLELIDTLKKINLTIPVIAITGFKNGELIEQLARRGCNNYIEKPFDEDQLLNIIEIALCKR